MATKYIDTDLLRKEIERIVKEILYSDSSRYDASNDNSWRNALEDIMNVINTLPEQNPPKWKIADKPIFGAMYIVRKVYGALVEHAVSGCVHKGDEYIIVKELDKLPKED